MRQREVRLWFLTGGSQLLPPSLLLPLLVFLPPPPQLGTSPWKMESNPGRDSFAFSSETFQMRLHQLRVRVILFSSLSESLGPTAEQFLESL